MLVSCGADKTSKIYLKTTRKMPFQNSSYPPLLLLCYVSVMNQHLPISDLVASTNQQPPSESCDHIMDAHLNDLLGLGCHYCILIDYLVVLGGFLCFTKKKKL